MSPSRHDLGAWPRRLTDRGLPVRIGSRAGSPPFDWADPSTWAPALSGADRVYLS
jgi:uncharacterized protein YbjT (DUF2867 family)